MEEILRAALAEQNALIKDSLESSREMSEAHLEAIKHPWKGTVENIKEAVETIKTIGENDEI